MQGVKFQGTLAESFLGLVDRRGPDECWEWQGAKNDKGYAMLSVRRASHVALELDGRPRPAGLCALHSCDNPPCVNPAHLRWGTNGENAREMVQRGRHQANRKTHCVRGHPLEGSNKIERKNGQRGCRACQRIFDNAYKEKRRAGQG